MYINNHDFSIQRRTYNAETKMELNRASVRLGDIACYLSFVHKNGTPGKSFQLIKLNKLAQSFAGGITAAIHSLIKHLCRTASRYNKTENKNIEYP